MSLINDALKKAQRQRTGEGDMATGSGSAAGGLRRASGSPPSPSFILLGGGVLAGAILALAVVLFFTRNSANPANAEVAKVAAPENPPPRPAATATPAASTLAPVSLTIAATPSTQSAPVEETATKTPETTKAPAAEQEVATPPPAEPVPSGPAVRPRPSLRMIEAVEAFRVAGIRASGSDPRVLMNDRVFRIGDSVDHALGIKLTDVTANSLTFVDESGATYTRNF